MNPPKTLYGHIIRCFKGFAVANGYDDYHARFTSRSNVPTKCQRFLLDLHHHLQQGGMTPPVQTRFIHNSLRNLPQGYKTDFKINPEGTLHELTISFRGNPVLYTRFKHQITLEQDFFQRLQEKQQCTKNS